MLGLTQLKVEQWSNAIVNILSAAFDCSLNPCPVCADWRNPPQGSFWRLNEKVCVYTQRAAAVMSLIQSDKLNGHDPYAYLKDVLARLPT